MRLRTRSVVVRNGIVRVTVECPVGEPGPCTGRLVLLAGGKTLGAKAFSIRGGRSATVSVRLSAAAKRRLRRRNRLAATARAIARDVAGNTRTTEARLNIRAA
jgi:hypothetical protein